MNVICDRIGRTRQFASKRGRITRGLRRARWFAAVLLTAVGISPARGDFHYEVKRDKLWGAEPGVLTIEESGIRYRSENGKTALELRFEDIYKADVSDPGRIHLYVYDRSKMRFTNRRRLEFRIREGTAAPALAQFLAERIERPVVGVYPTQNSGPEIPAYHRHLLGGCHGSLQFGPRSVSFQSDEAAHSRTWVYRDIQTVGTMNAFHFRLTTLAETFNFDLKRRLSPEDYRNVWRRVYAAEPPGL